MPVTEQTMAMPIATADALERESLARATQVATAVVARLTALPKCVDHPSYQGVYSVTLFYSQQPDAIREFAAAHGATVTREALPGHDDQLVAVAQVQGVTVTAWTPVPSETAPVPPTPADQLEPVAKEKGSQTQDAPAVLTPEATIPVTTLSAR